MARRALLVTALCGCNAIYGNDRVIARDAQLFDAPADAAFHCPEVGSAAPEFNPELHAVMVQSCRNYSFAGDRATAECSVSPHDYELFEGPREGPLVVVASLVEPPEVSGRDQARLSSDATKLYFRRVDFISSQEIRIATRNPDNTFTFSGSVAAFGANLNDSISTIGHAADGDHVIVRASDTTLHEWAEHAGVWVPTLDHTIANSESWDQIKLSPNALVLVGHTPRGLFYTDRASVADQFTPPRALLTAPHDDYAPLITDDCGRLYVAGLGEVFYAQHR